MSVQKNLVGGFQDGDFILSVDLGLDLLPDLRLVLEENPEKRPHAAGLVWSQNNSHLPTAELHRPEPNPARVPQSG